MLCADRRGANHYGPLTPRASPNLTPQTRLGRKTQAAGTAQSCGTYLQQRKLRYPRFVRACGFNSVQLDAKVTDIFHSVTPKKMSEVFHILADSRMNRECGSAISSGAANRWTRKGDVRRRTRPDAVQVGGGVQGDEPGRSQGIARSCRVREELRACRGRYRHALGRSGGGRTGLPGANYGRCAEGISQVQPRRPRGC